MHRTVYFWRGLYPLLRRFCREKNVSFNKVVNCAVEKFLGQADVEELKFRAKLEVFAARRSRAETCFQCDVEKRQLLVRLCSTCPARARPKPFASA